MSTMPACDLSHHNDVTDMAAVVRACPLVILKATQGTTFTDPTYAQRVSQVRAVGGTAGAYHFAEGEDPAAEARAFLAVIVNPHPDVLGLDVEAAILTKQPGQFLVSWCLKWLLEVASHTGVAPHIYMDLDTVNGRNWSAVASRFPLWLACYRPTLPAVRWWPSVSIWQHTSIGRLPGVAGALDLDTVYNATTPAKPKGTEMQASDRMMFRDAYLAVDHPAQVNQDLTVKQGLWRAYNYGSVAMRDIAELRAEIAALKAGK